MANKKTDVAIVGVGWVGGIIAAELTKAGLEVVGLERGHDRSVSNWADDHDELRYAIRYELFQNTANETWTFRHNMQENALPMRQLGAFLPGTGIGGAGVHWNGQTWRFHPSDFTKYSTVVERYGKSAIPAGMTIQDWGITYDELEPYIDKFELHGRDRRQGGQPQGADHPGRQRVRGAALARVPGQAAARHRGRGAVSGGEREARLPPVLRARPRTCRSPTRTPTGSNGAAAPTAASASGSAARSERRPTRPTTVIPVALKTGKFKIINYATAFAIRNDGKTGQSVLYYDSDGPDPGAARRRHRARPRTSSTTRGCS